MSTPPPDDTVEGDEFTAAELGLTEYERIGERPPRRFEPWHRPRKQYVRRSQWLACLTDLFNDRDAADPLKYLGLPGTDLLDLRLFYESICVPQQRKLRFLGFHSGINPGSAEAVSLDISLQQVKLRELVHENSNVLHDDINKIGSGDSRAYQEARRSAPYDVINLDFCGGFITDEPRSLDSIYNALNRIMAFQRRLEPWLLLITGLVRRDTSDPRAARALHRLFLTALRCEGFRDACQAYFETNDLDNLDIESCSSNDYFHAIIIGFCIWVYELAQNRQTVRTNLRAAFYYRVNPESESQDLISMAIRLTPRVVAGPDPVGLAVGEETQMNACDAAVQAAQKLERAVDVDLRLSGDAELREILINENAQLLSDVGGYDVAAYREWVAQFPS